MDHNRQSQILAVEAYIAMGIFSSTKAKLAASKLVEEQLYEAAANEVASGQIRQGIWAQAIAETDGNEAAAKARYLKLRVEIMKAEADVMTYATEKAEKASRDSEESAKVNTEKHRAGPTPQVGEKRAMTEAGIVFVLSIGLIFLISLVLLAPAAFSASTQALELNASCNFKKYIMYRLASGTTATSEINQSMVIRDGQTSRETSAADGTVRATNSKTWSHVRDTVWVGDFGELLTVDGWGKGFGTHEAVIQNTLPGFWAATRIGECTGDFGGE